MRFRDRARSPYFLCVAAYLAALLLVRILGYRMVVPSHYWQLLSPKFLIADFRQSLLYLHMQPPLLNLGLGSALSLGNALGIRAETILMAFAVLAGGVGVAAAAWLCSKMIPNRKAAAACALIIVLHPGVYLTQHHYFYTYYEWVLLLLTAAAVFGHLERPSAGRLAAVCGLMTLLVYTRSLFHFLWALAVLGAVAWWGLSDPRLRAAGRPARERLRVAGCLAAAAVLMIAWPLKNHLLFGTFTYSSWSGYNLSRGLSINWKPNWGLQVPDRFKDVPAVAQTVLEDGSLNWNSYVALKNFEELDRRARQVIRNDPRLVLEKAVHNYWYSARFSMRHPYGGFYGLDKEGEIGPVARAWMSLYDRVLFLDSRRTEDLAANYPANTFMKSWSFFALAFPVLIVAAVARIISAWRTDRVRARTAAFMLLAILWVLAMTLFVDGTEGNRIRFSTEPFLLILAFWLWPRRGEGDAAPSSD